MPYCVRATIVAVTLLCLSFNAPAQTVVDDAALGNEAESVNWAGYGRTYSEQVDDPG